MNFTYQHIGNIMAFMGVDLYFYQSVFLTVSPDEPLEIDAYNEFYFLAGVEHHLSGNQRGFALISAENDLIELDSASNIQTANYTEHFTGKVSISLKPYGQCSGKGNLNSPLTGQCTLNFFRVTPASFFDHENPRKQN
ncbi:MAG: hypothetical protein FWE63_01975 [Bacteroidales bacterium]|nr:hypothetical protein [Bacteroidales bacterium]